MKDKKQKLLNKQKMAPKNKRNAIEGKSVPEGVENQNTSEEIINLIRVLFSLGYEVTGYKKSNDYPIENTTFEIRKVVP
jgi:hypothetical protein